MSELFDLVTERPDISINLDNLNCPFCKSNDLKQTGHVTTMVGGNPDPNHHWRDHHCNNCNQDFVVEHKLDNFWITKDRVVLKGIPSCYESYIYHCKHCGGNVHRNYDGGGNAGNFQVISFSIDENGKHAKNYSTHFKCEGCNSSITTEDDYYDPLKDQRVNQPIRKLSGNFIIEEQIGMGKAFHKENDEEILGYILEGLK